MLTILTGVLVGVAVAAAIHMPKVEAVADFAPSIITELHDAEGESFARFARERRILLEDGDVPAVLQNALVAAEDSNFFEHGGVDARGIMRAMVSNVKQGGIVQGASTLTMQLARNLFLSPAKTWQRKVEEALLSVEIEKNYSKQQIITMYCNLVNVGHGNYGMEAASQYYFAKPVGDLEPQEAAMLVGIVQRPSDYSPYRIPDRVLTRRNYVLRRMREESYLTKAEYDEAMAKPLGVEPQRPLARIAPYFAEEIRRYLENTYGTRGLLEQGLRVDTTLDQRVQSAAEDSLRAGLARLDHARGWRGPLGKILEDNLEEYKLPGHTLVDLSPGVWNKGIVLASDRTSALVKLGKQVLELTPDGIKWTGRKEPRSILSRGDVAWFRIQLTEEGDDRLILEQEPLLESAMVVIESATGAVRAMVGGWDFRRSQFNRVTQARRQVGSAFKAFVFGAALETGYTPADTLFDAPVVFEGAEQLSNYSPRNYYREYYGILTLRRALEESRNVTAVKLQDLVGVDQVLDFARRSGIRSDLPPYPSLALGSADLSPLELASAYSAIANRGVHLEPYWIEKVSHADGRALEEHQPQASKAMEPATAFVLSSILEGVVDRGTGISASWLDVDLAGKTGTTDVYTDAWFVGYTPKYAILTWVGYDEPRSIGPRMSGAAAALPIWKGLVERGLEEGWIETGGTFPPPPPGVVFVPVERRTGFLATPQATDIVDEAFLEGTEPIRRYSAEWGSLMELPWYQQEPHYIPKTGERMPDDVEDWTLVYEAWDADEEDEEGEDGEESSLDEAD